MSSKLKAVEFTSTETICGGNSGHTTGAAGTEGGRRPTGVPAAPVVKKSSEVIPSKKRRRLTTAYKIKVLETVESLRSQGQFAIGAYLRSEGLYYSSVSRWSKQREQRLLTTTKQGRQSKCIDSLSAENKKLRQKLDSLQKKLEKTELIVDLQKKLSRLMEIDEKLELNAVK